MRTLEGLGLATLAWLTLAAIEIALRGASLDVPLALRYLPSAALVLSALATALVALAHAVYRAIAARWPKRALAGVALLLAIAGAPFCFQLSGALVDGDWIAKQSWAGALRFGLLGALELAWLGAWAFYGASLTVRSLRWRAVLAIGALGVLAGVSIALQGPLLAYTSLAKHAVLPAWLLAFGLMQPLAEHWPRAARRAGLATVAIGVLSLGYSALERDIARFASSEVAGSNSFAAIAESMIAMRGDDLGDLPFEEARGMPCAEAHQPEPLALKADQRRNVIWLSVDTMRRDAIDKRFGNRAVAPNIEAFSKRSVFFDRAVAPASGTLFSLSSAVSGYTTSQLFYMGKPPQNIFARVHKKLPAQRIVLPEWNVFRGGSYKKLILQRTPVTYVPRKRDPVTSLREALASAKAAGKRGFFWMHLTEPHMPYEKHAKYNFGSGKPERYYGEVAFADAIVGRALEYLEANGYFENSLIVIFADHGETLGEHGRYFGHGVSMRAKYTDIPLLVHYPGAKPRVSKEAVSLSGMTATVLHYLGMEIPDGIIDCSLLQPDAALARCAPPISTSYGLDHALMTTIVKNPLKSYADLEGRAALIAKDSKWPREVAFTTTDHRYLLNLETGGERMFDRVRDPREKQNLVQEDRALTGRFRGITERWAKDEALRIACQLPDND